MTFTKIYFLCLISVLYSSPLSASESSQNCPDRLHGFMAETSLEQAPQDGIYQLNQAIVDYSFQNEAMVQVEYLMLGNQVLTGLPVCSKKLGIAQRLGAIEVPLEVKIQDSNLYVEISSIHILALFVEFPEIQADPPQKKSPHTNTQWVAAKDLEGMTGYQFYLIDRGLVVTFDGVRLLFKQRDEPTATRQ